MPTYTFDFNLVSYVDWARYTLGDTKVDPTDNTNGKTCFMPDETISRNIAIFGWSQGIVSLASALLTKYAQEPTRFLEGNGITIDIKERLIQWAEVKLDGENGRLPDPLTTTPETVPQSSKSFSQNFIPTQVSW